MEEKIKLLLVDDEPHFLETICKRLQLRGFDVTPVSNGEEALKAAQNKELEVALVDLKMPGMDGEQVLEQLKKEHKFMEVIILTGHGSTESAIRSTKLGAHSYLQKPCELDTLLHAVKEAYQRRIQKKLGYKPEELKQLLTGISPESSLEILTKLKTVDTEAK